MQLRRHLVTGLTLATLVLPVRQVTAGGDVRRFTPGVTADGLLGVSTTDTLLPAQLSLGTTLSFADNPLVWRYADGTYDPVVDHQLMLDATVAVGIVHFIDVAVNIPVALVQGAPGDGGLGKLRGGGIGDIHVSPRVEIADERSYGYGGAIVADIGFPTGDAERFLGDDGVTVTPRFIGSLPFSAGRLIGSAAYKFRQDTPIADITIQDELSFNLGAELFTPLEPLPMNPVLELSGVLGTRDTTRAQNTSLELLGGLRTRMLGDVVLTVGAGAGLSHGVGTPAYRVIAGLAYLPATNDADRDGLSDDVDTCPYEPEDRDGFEDGDGCPDWDNDGDGVADADDECPTEREDDNGYLDDDGCPDAAGMDSDGDGITDLRDRCPNEREDKDNFKDDDGCPELDNDRDGVPDKQDRCPVHKETINGIQDDDGCPDEGEGLTEVLGTRIEIKQTILFESGRAILRPESENLLNQVALQILAHPEIVKVRIEGHTDNLGDEDDNLYLSQDRADAVRRYLLKRGVPKGMLEAQGFGEVKPIDSNDTREGRTRNRRVEFIIQTTQGDDGGG